MQQNLNFRSISKTCCFLKKEKGEREIEIEKEEDK